jgi:hypothetical protein
VSAGRPDRARDDFHARPEHWPHHKAQAAKIAERSDRLTDQAPSQSPVDQNRPKSPSSVTDLVKLMY